MQIPESKIEEISEKLDIADIVGNYVSLKQRGGKFWGRCPFHTEKTPSFSVSPDKNLYYCFGCQKGGTIFHFVMEMEKLSFVETVRMLAEKAGVIINTYADTREDKNKAVLYDLHKRVCDSLSYILANSKSAVDARTYLQSRGISKETIEEFKIGYAPKDKKWMYNLLIKNNYSNKILAQSGLFSKKYPEFPLFANRIVFPVITIQGKTAAFSGRELGTRGPKYINSSETAIFKKKDLLYSIGITISYIRKSGFFILCEGNVDVLALYQAGIKNCIAPLGTSFTENQARLLKRYADRGIILFDGDKAGITATKKAITICENAKLRCSVVELKDNQDPADILEKEGPEALHNLLKCPINSFEYLLSKSIDTHNIINPEDKEAVITEIFSYIKNTDSAVTRESYLKELSNAVNVNFQAVLKDFEQSLISGTKKAIKVHKRTIGSEKIKTVMTKEENTSFELFLMFAVAANREYFSYMRNVLQCEDFTNPNSRTIYIAMEDCFRHGENSIDSLLNRIEDEDLKDIIAGKVASGEFSYNEDELIHSIIIRIKHASLVKKGINVDKRLKNSALDGMSIEEEKELLAEKIYLEEELKKLRTINSDRTAD